jgi:hypothetical protein
MAKLTLSVDDTVISRAKRYAEKHDVSVSRMVQDFLAAVVEEPSSGKLPPVLSSVRGVLKSGNREHYGRFLAKKYS